MTHYETLKRILWYIKGTIDFGLFYEYSNSFGLVGYSNTDWAGDMDDKKSTRRFVFYMEDTTFTRSSKKQFIVNMWSRICSYYIMCLSFHMAKEIIEEIMNAIKEAYWNLCGQLIIHCINKESSILL